RSCSVLASLNARNVSHSTVSRPRRGSPLTILSVDTSSTQSVFLRCAGHGRVAAAIVGVRPRRRWPPPFLQQQIPETYRLAAPAHDAVAPPANTDLAKEASRHGHRLPSARQTQRQAAREGQSVIVRGPLSRRAFPKPAESSQDVLDRREQKPLSGGEHPLPVDGQVKR